MSEGYQRRPEEKPQWRAYASVCWSLFNLLGMAVWVTLACTAWRQNAELKNEWADVVRANGRLLESNAALTKQLDYWTCRVQFDPMPVPEQTNESPTLIEEGK